MMITNPPTWQFWIDRGGTFTDIVARRPDGQIIIHKLLSENIDQYRDAPCQGIRDILGIKPDQPVPLEQIETIKMGTTVATNALLERKGDRNVLLINKGFRDALRIGYQNRPQIFAQQIILPEMLYEEVIEIEGRYSAEGEEIISLNDNFMTQLEAAYQRGITSCSIVLMHSYRYPDHENKIAKIAKQIGFTQISVSHEISPLIKLISRGDTTVVDAYLSPILKRYINQVIKELQTTPALIANKLIFMQSNGGLVNANLFQGKDSILSGPAGGIVGAVQTSLQAGFRKIITFDMGGTSTDVAHFATSKYSNNIEYEREFETEIAGVRLRSPIMAINTVAAGGGSILTFDGSRYRVGPASAGANPGPASYRRGGPLTITDCNVILGKIQPQFFPAVFGSKGDLPLDVEIVKHKFTELAAKIGDNKTPEAVAAGFLTIAIEKMANAIKKISLQRGYDVSKYTLTCFGGAGGQHACLIADALGIKQIFIHPYAGVLSAYGIGLADIRVIKESSYQRELKPEIMANLRRSLAELEREAKQELNSQDIVGENQEIQVIKKLSLKYAGTDTSLLIDLGHNCQKIRANFTHLHRQRYNFIMPEKALIIDSISVEVIGKMANLPSNKLVTSPSLISNLQPIAEVPMYTCHQWYNTPVFQRDNLQYGHVIMGPAIIIDPTGTNIIEPGWQAEINQDNCLILSAISNHINLPQIELELGEKPDPVLLEIFNNLFRSIAEQMGITLQNTASSVNIKERLDFSCAIFDQTGNLVANAPHIPVHLGSMSESITALINDKNQQIKPGHVYASNNPYNGGTHLPDITVITPVFHQNYGDKPLFYVASRGHHSDIGGITPGSMPPHSKYIEQEGILLDNFLLVSEGIFQEKALKEKLQSGEYPVRNISQNIADLHAQIAANEQGVKDLLTMVTNYGLNTVQSYMIYVQNNAAESVRKSIDILTDGEFSYQMDNGGKIQVKITIDKKERSAIIDFTGTSPQQESNFNAPASVCKAAVLYVFRTLVADDIPLNAGCLQPLKIIIPEGCMLNPCYPAAVVAGNVETSQIITDVLYAALGIMAASQGTMNNFTFGDEIYQYYETICGGSGAGANFHGTDAVHTHMTNSRLTDPEVLEHRFPVILESFAIRHGSGGKGKYRGGNGVIRQIKFRQKMTAAILSERRIIPPFGLRGGSNAMVGRNYVIRNDQKLELLNSKDVVEMNTGDIFVIETPGGGGFGE